MTQGRPKGSKNKVKAAATKMVAAKNKKMVKGAKAVQKSLKLILAMKKPGRGRPRKLEALPVVKATRGRPRKVEALPAVKAKRGRPAGSKNKIESMTSNMVHMTSTVGVRPMPLKDLAPEEKLKAILFRGASNLFKEIINKPKSRGRPKNMAGNDLVVSIAQSIMNDSI